MTRMLANRRNIYALITTLLTLILLVMGACKSSPTPVQTSTPTLTTAASTPTSAPAITVNITSKTGLGSYLVDGRGMTLYWTTRDAVGKSNISGATLANWPVFYTPNVVVPSSLNPSDFGSITRTDGAQQTTFKGWPALLLHSRCGSR